MNAIFYQNRTGCQWRYLPHDLPSWSAVFYYVSLWREDGLDQRIQELLRCQVREKARRLEDPSLVIIDTQSVRAAAGVPKTTTGLDVNKKASGVKRGLALDVLGLIIGVVVLPASAHDNAAGIALLDQAAEKYGNRLEKALVDQGFKDEVVIHGVLNDINVEIVRRNPADQGKGFGAPAATEPDPSQSEASTAYQAIVNAFNQYAGQAFRARELHELLDLPTDEASVNITRSRLTRLLRQGLLTQPGRGRYQKRT
ncbi:transposase [Streptomyces sp. NPDC057418]|uniref:transposase n=1 Tax=unclassified Streptomyces TaxID=2593676 RepID=UPI0036CE2D9E